MPVAATMRVERERMGVWYAGVATNTGGPRRRDTVKTDPILPNPTGMSKGDDVIINAVNNWFSSNAPLAEFHQ